MKQDLLKRRSLFGRLLLTLLLTLALLIPFFSYAAIVKEYTVNADAPTVDGNQVFSEALAIADGEEANDVDVCIHGIGAEFYFPYDSIFRNTGRWESFSGAVSQLAPADSPLPEKLKKVLGNDDSVYLDFHDGDHYPGTASVTVTLSDSFRGKQINLYEYTSKTDDESKPDGTLTPVISGMKIASDGALVLTVSEAHDYLIIETKTADACAGKLEDFSDDILISTAASPIGGISWTVFILLIVIAILVIGSVTYAIIVSIRKHKNEKQKRDDRPIEVRLNEINREKKR